MICPRCRIWLPDHAKFCPTCGSPRSTFTPDRPPQPEPAPAPAPIPAAVAPPAPAPPPVPAALPVIAPYSLSVQPDVAAGLQLQPGETVQQVWRAGLTVSAGGGDDEDGPNRVSGVLVATDRRICFLSKGLLSRSYRMYESIPLPSVTYYAVSRFLRVKGLTIDVAEPRGPRRIELVNVCEADPSTLKALTPATPEDFKANLDRLFRRT